MSKETKFFTYKGFPLVRKGNTLYYGNMSDKFVSMITILNAQKVGGIDVAEKVRVQLISTAPDTDASKLVVKASEQDGLYNALDIADIWLNKALQE